MSEIEEEAVGGRREDGIKPKPRPSVKALIDADQLGKDVEIQHSDLSASMHDQASLFVHYGVLAAKAAKQVDDLKLRVELVEAKVDKIIRDEAASATDAEGNPAPRKLTEALITKEIARHPLMTEATRLLNEAKYVEALSKTAVESFRHRKDMLVQLGAQGRAEMEGEIRVAVAEGRGTQRERMMEKLNAKKETV